MLQSSTLAFVCRPLPNFILLSTRSESAVTINYFCVFVEQCDKAAFRVGSWRSL